MYCGKLQKAELKEMLKAACEMAGRPFSDTLLDVFYEWIAKLPPREAREAFSAFMAHGKMPTPANVLAYCGYSVPKTEREIVKVADEDELRNPKDDSYKTEKGEYAFEAIKICESLSDAEEAFKLSRKCLDDNDWYVHHHTDFEVNVEIGDGKHRRKSHAWKRVFYCIKPKPDRSFQLNEEKTL